MERFNKEDILILAIESSCDETAASVVKNGREVLSNIIYTQIALHTQFGGVVPEIASRKHIEKINQVIEQALKEAEVTLQDITAIAVTYGPGLVGALLVGVAEAKAISFATGIPVHRDTIRAISSSVTLSCTSERSSSLTFSSSCSNCFCNCGNLPYCNSAALSRS